MKKPFAKINYRNCGVDYDYTICELSDIATHVESFKSENEDLTQERYDNFKRIDLLPTITLKIIMMTNKEYEDWFEENVESTK